MQLQSSLTAVMLLRLTLAMSALGVMTAHDGGEGPRKPTVEGEGRGALSGADWTSIRAVFDGLRQGIVPTGDDRARSPAAIEPRTKDAYARTTDTDRFDRAGWSVSVSGDTVVIGAPYEDSNATGVNGNPSDNTALDSGAAYVFVRCGEAWRQQAYLKASNTEPGDQFGWAVAISQDVIVVGAPSEDSAPTGANGDQGNNEAKGSGAAYVFVREGQTWNQQAYLKASNANSLDGFGHSVAIFGNTLVVGAPGEDSGATGVGSGESDNSKMFSGAAYVFVSIGERWSQQAYLKASNTDAMDGFGYSVSVSGDKIAVGAWAECSDGKGVGGNQGDNSASQSGAAYIFSRIGEIWRQEGYLKASNADSHDWFGTSISLSGETIIVGAGGEDSNATGANGNPMDNRSPQSGAAYVFTHNEGTWSQEAYLKATNADPVDRFGFSVSASGDAVLVGAYLEDSQAIGVNGMQCDNSASNSGAAYVFVRKEGTWGPQVYLKPSKTDAYASFGLSVSLSSEMAVVGAPLTNINSDGLSVGSGSSRILPSGAAHAYRVSVALVQKVDTGCGSMRLPPSLSASAPRLGHRMTVSLVNATPLSTGTLFMGSLSPAPQPIDTICSLQLARASALTLLSFTTDSRGFWSATLDLPQTEDLVGKRFALQAAVLSNSSPIGLDLTNGLSVVLGY